MSKLIINGQEFASKAAIKRHVQAITKAGPRELDGVELEFMRALFERHPSAVEKIGAGIRSIRVRRVPPYNTLGFEIERIDGSATDASYIECLTASTPYAWFRSACRSAVVEQVLQAKIAAFSAVGVACPFTGEQLSRETCHADHEEPWTFEAVVGAFIAERSIDIATVAYNDGDNVTESNFSDPDLADAFAAFHRDRARLRMVSKKANLSILRKGR